MANIVRSTSEDQLGTIIKPWSKVVAQHYTLKAITIDPGVEPPANTLYVIDNVLYFNGSPITGGGITYTPRWKAYELTVQTEQITECNVWVPGLSVTLVEGYPPQAHVLLNGVEIVPSMLAFTEGAYGDVFESTPVGQDPEEVGTKITITIPPEGGTSFVFEVGTSVLVWNNE